MRCAVRGRPKRPCAQLGSLYPPKLTHVAIRFRFPALSTGLQLALKARSQSVATVTRRVDDTGSAIKFNEVAWSRLGFFLSAWKL